jgi:hypothetical protein
MNLRRWSLFLLIWLCVFILECGGSQAIRNEFSYDDQNEVFLREQRLIKEVKEVLKAHNTDELEICRQVANLYDDAIERTSDMASANQGLIQNKQIEMKHCDWVKQHRDRESARKAEERRKLEERKRKLEEEARKKRELEEWRKEYITGPEFLRDLACFTKSAIASERASIKKEKEIGRRFGVTNQWSIYASGKSITRYEGYQKEIRNLYRQKTGKWPDLSSCPRFEDMSEEEVEFFVSAYKQILGLE